MLVGMVARLELVLKAIRKPGNALLYRLGAFLPVNRKSSRK